MRTDELCAKNAALTVAKHVTYAKLRYAYKSMHFYQIDKNSIP